MQDTKSRIPSLCEAAFVAASGFVLSMSRAAVPAAAGKCLMAFAAAYAALVAVEALLRTDLWLLERVGSED